MTDKYQEALERAREIKGQHPTRAESDLLDLIFPELAESEDERIRKEMIEHFKSKTKDTWCNMPVKSILAWLEKQKEQKPSIEICPHSTKSKSYKENGYPIEDCDYGLEIAYDILERTFGEVRGYQTDDGIREHQTAIEAVRKAKEQTPAEWTDFKWTSQDERCRSKLIDVLELADAAYPATKAGRDELWEWLKELPMKFPNKNAFITGTLDNDDDDKWSQTEEILGVDGNPTCYKQKPEWSKEDERHLRLVTALLQSSKEKCLAGFYKDVDESIAWLQSLRPQPKDECGARRTKRY